MLQDVKTRATWLRFCLHQDRRCDLEKAFMASPIFLLMGQMRIKCSHTECSWWPGGRLWEWIPAPGIKGSRHSGSDSFWCPMLRPLTLWSQQPPEEDSTLKLESVAGGWFQGHHTSIFSPEGLMMRRGVGRVRQSILPKWGHLIQSAHQRLFWAVLWAGFLHSILLPLSMRVLSVLYGLKVLPAPTATCSLPLWSCHVRISRRTCDMGFTFYYSLCYEWSNKIQRGEVTKAFCW